MQLPKGNVIGFGKKRFAQPKKAKQSASNTRDVTIKSAKQTIPSRSKQKIESTAHEATLIEPHTIESGTRKTKSTVVSKTLNGDMRLVVQGLLAPLNLNSSEGKLAALNLLDDTLMNLSLVLDSLQKRMTKESDIHCPETVKSLCEVSKEIRSLTQLKFDVARELTNLELKRIRLAMEVERHAKGILNQ